MVTSTFAAFEAAAYGELVKPPPLNEGPGHSAWAFVASQDASPAASTGLLALEAVTCGFATFGPVDVYRLGAATSSANCWAAAAPMPGSRCW